MDGSLINPTLYEHKLSLDRLLAEIERFSTDVQNPQLQKTISNLRENINEPFLFVIIGEVKAGKSRFINALLEDNICDVGADPRTAVVNKIVYSDKEQVVEVKPNLLRDSGRPVPILKQLAIVDTPGTNSPFIEHETITKEFIPNSDLVFFVFFAKNPYTNTAWELVNYAQQEWNRPIAFVLQQADLADEVELETAQQYVQQEATRRQITTPKIFATSAKLEEEGVTDQSGFAPVRQFINDTITGGQGYLLKLKSNMDVTGNIITKLDGSILSLQEQLRIDQAAVKKVQGRLTQGQSQSQYEIQSLIERLVARYEYITNGIKEEFREGLSLIELVRRSFFSIFNRRERVEVWVNELKKRCQAELETSLEEISQEGAKHFVNGIQQLLKSLLDDLRQLENPHFTSPDLSVPIVERRYEVIDVVKTKVSNLLTDESFVNGIADKADGVAPGVAGGGILAVIGGVIAAVTEVVILDILGSIFLGLGVFIAGGVLFFKRKSIIQKFERELDRNKAKFKSEVSGQLNSKLSIIYEEIDRSFVDWYQYVEAEEASIRPLLDRFEKIQADATALSDVIDSML